METPLAWTSHTKVAADGSRRCLHGEENAPTAVGGYVLSADLEGVNPVPEDR
ncbi:MAG: hypothetical protein NT154_19285 [Verrucomicrobia bacterium]|nr:hypothetical protein [Verrucomicrobiota bacterium]